MEWNKIADNNSVENAIKSLKANGIEAQVVETVKEAKKTIQKMLPKGAEVMTMLSTTLESTGITDEINDSKNYISIKNLLNNEKTTSREKKRLGAAPEWAIGSVHAITEEGHIFVASNTGSQISAYVYGADRVIFVVGAQKIVRDDESAKKRIYSYVLPLESDRARKAYGVAGSNVSKLLTINKEVTPNRISVILVREVLGF